MKKIGFITIGQAPRNDIMSDLLPILGDNIEILQRGALDGLSADELSKVAPEPGDTVLVSSLRDGSSIIMAEEKIMGLLQNCINELENLGTDGIMFLCTGDFKDSLTSNVPMLYPNRLLRGLIPFLCHGKKLIALVPDEEQRQEAAVQWRNVGMEIETCTLSPYDSTIEDFLRAAKEMKKLDADYILMDCMGYSSKMKAYIAENTGKSIILPRTLSATILKELI